MVHVSVITTVSSSLDKPLHNPKLGIFVYVLSFAAVVGGFLFGYDTGIVSSAMLYVPSNSGMRPMNTIWQELVVSITPGMAAVGSLLSGHGSDRYGRKKIIIGSSFIFTIGAVICAVAIEKVTLTFGRLLLGIAIGFASMIVPIYVGEASPTHIRGRLVTGFQLMITVGLLCSSILAGGFSYVSPVKVGWRLMFGFAAIPSAIQFISFFFLPESPRWLYQNGYKEDAHRVLDRIYNGDKAWIAFELAEIAEAQEQQRKYKGPKDFYSILRRVLATPHIRRSLIIGCTLQAFQQLSGVNTIMYYAGKIIQSAGVKDTHTTIWISAGVSAVNFIGTFIPMILIDRVGRRVLLLTSMIGVAVTLFLLGGSFYLINHDSAPVHTNYMVPHANKQEVRCQRYSNCDYCVTEENCGFCKEKTSAMGYCLPFVTGYGDDKSSTGYCMNGTTTGIGKKYEWSPSFCTTKYTVVPIILMVVYLGCFSSGYAPLPWVLNAEFYPLWARSTCVALSTASNWIFNLIISLTFLSLSQSLTKFGTFFLYGIITIVALIFVFFFVPETKGSRIEEVETLFMTDKERENQYNQNIHMHNLDSNIEIQF